MAKTTTEIERQMFFNCTKEAKTHSYTIQTGTNWLIIKIKDFFFTEITEFTDSSN